MRKELLVSLFPSHIIRGDIGIHPAEWSESIFPMLKLIQYKMDNVTVRI